MNMQTLLTVPQRTISGIIFFILNVLQIVSSPIAASTFLVFLNSPVFSSELQQESCWNFHRKHILKVDLSVRTDVLHQKGNGICFKLKCLKRIKKLSNKTIYFLQG